MDERWRGRSKNEGGNMKKVRQEERKAGRKGGRKEGRMEEKNMR